MSKLRKSITISTVVIIIWRICTSGIKEIHRSSKGKNILLSIYTGKGRKAAIITLKKLAIHDYFDLIITGDDVQEHKPSAEGINKFLEQFSLRKNEVLMIGDSPADIKAANSAGVKIASVLWDSYAKEKVLQLKSDFVFHSVEELKMFLEKIFELLFILLFYSKIKRIYKINSRLNSLLRFEINYIIIFIPDGSKRPIIKH
ncbi:MAG: HAD family hydrolase [Ignavibacteriales bacterium]|nr:HAD family hydrolase [Ignavibacteriales bacterium]